MPIVDITLVQERQPDDDVAQRLADACGAVLGSAPQGTWVRLKVLNPSHYAENGADQTPCPVFVEVMRRDLPDESALAGEARRLSEAVAEVVGRSREHVHVVYQPAAAGRVAFGGELLSDH